MSNITNIISRLDKELHEFVTEYENQINVLKKENQQLSSELQSIMSENKHLKEQISKLNIERKPTVDKRISLELIDNLFLSNDVKDSILLLDFCIRSVEANQFELVNYFLELLVQNTNSLLHQESRHREKLDQLFQKLLVVGSENLYITVEKVVESWFRLISKLHETYLKTDMIHFLKANLENLMVSVINLNEPKIIIDLLRLLMTYKLNSELNKSLSHIIQTEWDYLEIHLSKEDFCFFLWIAFLFDLDQILLDSAEESVKWLNGEWAEDLLYTFLYDCINKKQIENKEKLDYLIDTMGHSTIFNNHERQLISEKVNKTLQLLLRKQISKREFNGKLFIVKLEELDQLIEEFQLQPEVVTVPLFESKGDRFTNNYIETKLYFKSPNIAFITKEAVNRIQQKCSPLVLKAFNYKWPMNTIVKTSKLSTKEAFQWPRTDIKENSKSDDHEQSSLNENSELKRLGYQITGLTRSERWTILEKAVPKLGLKKVVHTIANNVRLRKGQKNGFKKFHNAISEWEYDLEKLKSAYYKKDFNWPSV